MGQNRTALISGVSGQDGAYLAKLLLDRNYRVVGTSRDAQVNGFTNLDRLGIKDRVELESMSLNDFRSVLQLITTVEPDEIYNLSGQSSVALSFRQPVETLESTSIATLNLLEAIRFSGKQIKLYNAGSSECFGDNDGVPASETTAFRPRSPYAVGKAAAFWQVANYREAYGLYAVSGILFNHESPLRSERFVTRKIVSSACRISRGSQERLSLGNLNVQRDWGWASEYVEAIWRMLQQEVPEDLVIATGETNPLERFVECVFERLDLNWKLHTDLQPTLLRPADLSISRANPSRAREKLGWTAQSKLEDVARMMVDAELSGEG